jgi:glyoxylase-like metal-dependent hydrolase (beta-lactamase superfamily II)
MLQIGDLRIHRINESDYWVDPGGAFGLVPRALWSRDFPVTADHLVKMSSNCLLVQTGDQNVLIDCGYGHKVTEKQRRILRLSRPDGTLADGLQQLGLTVEDIDLVINTHLHADHVSGNTRYNEAGEVVAVFPNAEYVVPRREYVDASQPNERTRATYLVENFEPLVKTGPMRLLEGDGELAPGVHGVATPGHTPGHMSIVFESQGQYGIQVCDMATYAVHFERLGWMTAYDVEPLVTLETKRHWRQWVRDHDAVVFFPHDPYRPAGRWVDDRVEPLSADWLRNDLN